VTLHAKFGMPYSQRYPLDLYLINDVEILSFSKVSKCLILIIPLCFPSVEMRNYHR